MLRLDLEHSGEKLASENETIASYTSQIKAVRASRDYDQPECSINLPRDEEILKKVKSLADKKVSPELKYSIVIGIGGSNLGTKAIYDALIGYKDIMEPNRFPKLFFAETTDPEWLLQISKLLESISRPEEVLLTTISKSGGTTETLANFEIITKVLRDKFGEINNRIVVITDDGSNLMEEAKKINISALGMPQLVGGRYSVLSAVGLFPLVSVGVNIEDLRRGAVEMLDTCLDNDNLSASSASALFAQKNNGRTINDNFFFHPELESIGKWYRQLMGESVGKEKSLNGDIVNTGITPTVSLGSTDLHSVGQLYLGGPKDKFTTFVSTQKSVDISVPEERVFPSLVPMINGKTSRQIMSAILDGVKIAYQNAGLPFMEVILDEINEYCIGSYLQFKMLEMMYLGRLLNVNSFDQPNVESYKVETKRLLSE